MLELNCVKKGRNLSNKLKAERFLYWEYVLENNVNCFKGKTIFQYNKIILKILSSSNNNNVLDSSSIKTVTILKRLFV